MTERFRRWASLGIWLVAAIAATYLWWDTGHQRSLVVGVVEGKVHRVGPVEASKLRAVFVRAGERVKAGQALASLETADLDAEIAVAHGRMDELLADIEAQTELAVTSARGAWPRGPTCVRRTAGPAPNKPARRRALHPQSAACAAGRWSSAANRDGPRRTLRTRHARLSRSAQHNQRL